MRLRVYIDTSVIGGCFDREFNEWSNLLFDEFRNGKKIAVLSDITFDELELAGKEIKNVINRIPEKYREYLIQNEEVIELAEKYITDGAVTMKFFEDALHIAIATINKVDVLVSWNFKHIVNINRIRLYNSVNLKSGYSMIDIRSPREILTEKEK